MNILKGAPVIAAMLWTAVASAQGPISVIIDSKPIAFSDTPPREVNGRVLVPLRGVFEQMGAYVHWTDATQTVDVTKGDKSIRLRVGDQFASVDGQNINLDVPAKLIGGSTMVPLRFVSEAMGADVDWNPTAHAVIITTVNANAYNPPVVINNPPTQTQTQTNTYTLRHSTLGVNSVIPVTLDNALSSSSSRPGDTFTATVDTRGTDNYAGLPQGTRVEGHVVMARPRAGNDPGVLQVAFDRLRMPDNYAINIDGALSALDNNSVTRDNNGVLQANPSKVNKDNAMVYVGYGAGAGAVIGLLTKGNVLTDAIVGGALGFLFHSIQKNQQKPSDVQLNTGTQMGVRLNQAVSF